MTEAWLSTNDAAALLGITSGEVRDMAIAEDLYARLMHDHYEVSRESAREWLEWATDVGSRWHTHPVTVLRVAIYHRLRAEGWRSDEAIARVGRADRTAVRYEHWRRVLATALEQRPRPSRHHSAEDAMSAHLAERAGPEHDRDTDEEYRSREQNDYNPTEGLE